MSEPGSSPFSIRGVIEGFYGRPWTHDQRLDLIAFLAAHGMNTFAYAPKDDPLLRDRWRLRYGGSQLRRLAELVDACRSARVEFMYCLSPGLSVSYASQADLDALLAKYDSVAALGVRYFGLLLDDIPATLQHRADGLAFTDLAEAQISLIRRVYASFGPERRLIVCPTQYHGLGDEPYISRVGRALDPAIDIFWTGTAVCSATLDSRDAATFALSTGRPPTYWDNYPVNDGPMTSELHIGPYRGRDARLWQFSRGVIANGMELYEASKLPFATIADYLNAPQAYDPEASWRRQIAALLGEADAEAFALFADNVRSSPIASEDALLVGGALRSFEQHRRLDGDAVAAGEQLAEFADRLLAAADHLLRGPVRNRPLIDEARPWIEAFQIGGLALRRVAQLGLENRLERDAQAELLPFRRRLGRAGVRVFGDVLDRALVQLSGEGPPPA